MITVDLARECVPDVLDRLRAVVALGIGFPVAVVLGLYHEEAGSIAQLAINLVGIVAAAYAVLLARARATRRRRGRLARLP